jgi:hypothetical protein
LIKELEPLNGKVLKYVEINEERGQPTGRSASFIKSEPPRLLRRILSLKGLSYEEVEQVLARSP